LGKLKSVKKVNTLTEKPGGGMKTAEKISEALKKVSLLEKDIKEIIREIDDYDLERLLKKIDAQCMDLQHNLSLAKRLAEGLTQKRKKKKRAKRENP
jgi:hypothetical protein